MLTQFPQKRDRPRKSPDQKIGASLAWLWLAIALAWLGDRGKEKNTRILRSGVFLSERP